MIVESGTTQPTGNARAVARVVNILAPAKLNLFLDILGKRSDGYHELETLMVSVNLFDQIRLHSRDDDQIKLRVTSTRDIQSAQYPIPLDDQNLVVQALHLLQAHAQQTNVSSETAAKQSLGCDVQLLKRIPSQAGLGGASSDAAATLVAGNELWNLKLSDSQLHEMAMELGSDVPYFLAGGAAICRGRGEIIQPVESFAGLPVVIAKPQVGLSTPRVFEAVRIPKRNWCVDAIQKNVARGNPFLIARSLGNRLQPFAQAMTSQIARLAAAFSRVACLGHQMTGSGTAYFGIFANHRVAQIASQDLSGWLPDATIFCGRTIRRPNQIYATQGLGSGEK